MAGRSLPRETSESSHDNPRFHRKNSKPLCQINADPKSPPVADVSPEEYKFTPFQYITVCIITKVFSNYKPGKYRIKKNFFLLLP